MSDREPLAGVLAIAICLTCFAAWLTHIVVCIKLLTGASVTLLVVGLVIPPIGVLHGVLVWLGMGIGS